MENLTKREKAILDQLLQGKSNKEIAMVLSVSKKTVEKYLTSIYQKLGVSGRAEAITFSYRALPKAERKSRKSLIDNTYLVYLTFLGVKNGKYGRFFTNGKTIFQVKGNNRGVLRT